MTNQNFYQGLSVETLKIVCSALVDERQLLNQHIATIENELNDRASYQLNPANNLDQHWHDLNLINS